MFAFLVGSHHVTGSAKTVKREKNVNGTTQSKRHQHRSWCLAAVGPAALHLTFALERFAMLGFTAS